MNDASGGGGVVVTGASQGIGRHIALALAAQGARLVLAARNLDGLSETQRLVEDRGSTALSVETDATAPDDVERMVHMAIAAERSHT